MDELKKLTKPYADDDEDDYDDYDDEPVEEEEPEPAPRTTRRSVTPPEPSYTHGSGLDSGRSTGSRIVNINTTTQLQVVLVKPERFDNVSEIADHLRDKHSVLLNLEIRTGTLPAAWWISCPAAPMPWTARLKRWPHRLICLPRTMWRL